MSGGRRAVVLVLDGCGVGALPDAAAYGDAGASTLEHVARAVGGLDLPVLGTLGLGCVTPLAGVPPAAAPVLHGRLRPLGPGKDSATGHWELMGAVPADPLPTYPEGFPPEVLDIVRRETGRGVLCNRPYDGIGAITDFGARHLETGALILYTSQDSVLQLAAHADALPPEELRAACGRIRAALPARHAVGRVIARPFGGPPEALARIRGRRDFTLPPPGRTHLEAVAEAGVPVHAVGKVAHLFGGRGITAQHPGATNAEALDSVAALLGDPGAGLVFANLVETDQVYGHRKDVEGFHDALRAIDAAVGSWLPRLGSGDLLVLTADHGTDPTRTGTDHTREYAPLLARFDGHGGRRHDGPLADVGASALAWLTGRADPGLPGASFITAAA